MESRDEQELQTSQDLFEKMFRSAHTPIIITDGSASIEFDREEYDEQGNGEFEAEDLQITGVTIVDKNSPSTEGHIHVCGPFDPDEHLKVTVLCAGRDFTVTDMNGRININFHRGEYPEVTTAPTRRKFRQAARRIMGLEIQNSSGTVLHRCRVVPGNGRCIIRIIDDHIDDH